MRALLLSLFLVVIVNESLWANEYLIKFRMDTSTITQNFKEMIGGRLEKVSESGRLYKWTSSSLGELALAKEHPDVEYLVPNSLIRLHPNPSIEAHKAQIKLDLEEGRIPNARGPAFPDNPSIQAPPIQPAGSDPLLSNAWGLHVIGAAMGWQKTNKGKHIIIAITDTGVDYNHTDLIANMWRNTKEVPNDGIDNDKNGYIDDVVGWDFYSNDNLPYDLSMSLIDILLGQGNPGHGTHCAGVVAAALNNSLGTAGVAPLAQLMALRFISETGKGTLEGAVKAVDYAVDNGATIISASWGSEGEEPGDKPLREAIIRAKNKGVIFVAAAGNGRLDPATFKAAGYNNDTDPKPVYPATYPYENMLTVAATTPSDELAPFSNYGPVSVDLGAPGVKILSTVPGNRFQDTILDLGSLKITWDGTSMATPMVAGALAAIWSQNKSLSLEAVKERILKGTTSSAYLSGKLVTGGRLEFRNMTQ